MKLDCNVIQDLLPLYIDDVCSEQSRKLVEEHIKECEICQKFAGSGIITPILHIEPEKAAVEKAVKKGFKKIRNRWVISVILVAVVLLMAFVGWNGYKALRKTYVKEYYIGMAFMEQMQKGNYEKAFTYINTEYTKQEWLETWFEESELADFEERACSVFCEYAENLEKFGGIEKYEYIEISEYGYTREKAVVYRVSFSVLFNGEARPMDICISKDGIEAIQTDDSFIVEPLAQFGAWSHYLWQDYEGCYFDPETHEYVYPESKE